MLFPYFLIILYYNRLVVHPDEILGHIHQIGQRHSAEYAGFLQQEDHIGAQRGNGGRQRLRENHIADVLPCGQAQAEPGLRLTLLHSLDSAAEALRHVRAAQKAQARDGAGFSAELQADLRKSKVRTISIMYVSMRLAI